MSTSKYKVAIKCLVYNHEPYLRDCLEGFVMQQTDFPFVAIVHDDASTDHSADIIREYAAKYPDIIHPIYETENQWRKADGSLRKIMDAAIEATGAPYIALCEGDDYWTDPHKLQKQVDFLDAHPEYVLCCHRYKILNQNDGTWEQDYVKDLFLDNPNGFSFTNRDNMKAWITKTMTLMYRRHIVMPERTQFKYWRDVHLNYYLLKHGKGFCFPDDAAVYRRQNGGVFSSLSAMQKDRINYLVIHDLSTMNEDDLDLQEYLFTLHSCFFAGLRNRIQNGDRQFLWADIGIYLRVEYRKSGIFGVLYAIKKMLRSYTYRFL